MGNAHRKGNGGEAAGTASSEPVAGVSPKAQLTHLVDSGKKSSGQSEKLERVSLASVSASESSYISAVGVDNTLGSLPDLLQAGAVYKHSGVESDTDTSTAYESAGENEGSVSVAEDSSFTELLLNDPSAVSSPLYRTSALDESVVLDWSSDSVNTGSTTKATPDQNATFELDSGTEPVLSHAPEHLQKPDLNLTNLASSLSGLCLETPGKSNSHGYKVKGPGILDSNKKVFHLSIDSDVSADIIESDISADLEKYPPSKEEVKSFLEKYLVSGDQKSDTDLEQFQISDSLGTLNGSESVLTDSHLNRTITPEQSNEEPCLKTNSSQDTFTTDKVDVIAEEIQAEEWSHVITNESDTFPKKEVLSRGIDLTSERNLGKTVELSQEELLNKTVDLSSTQNLSQVELLNKTVDLSSPQNLSVNSTVDEHIDRTYDLDSENHPTKTDGLISEEFLSQANSAPVENILKQAYNLTSEDNVNKALNVCPEENSIKLVDVTYEKSPSKVADIPAEESQNKVADLSAEENRNKPAGLPAEENKNKPVDNLAEENLNKAGDLPAEKDLNNLSGISAGENRNEHCNTPEEKDIPAGENVNEQCDTPEEETPNKPVDVPTDILNKQAHVPLEENLHEPTDIITVEDNLSKQVDVLVEDNLNELADVLAKVDLNKPAENSKTCDDLLTEENLSESCSVLVEENLNEPADVLVEEKANKRADSSSKENLIESTDVPAEGKFKTCVNLLVEESLSAANNHCSEGNSSRKIVLPIENLECAVDSSLCNSPSEENQLKNEVQEVPEGHQDKVVDSSSDDTPSHEGSQELDHETELVTSSSISKEPDSVPSVSVKQEVNGVCSEVLSSPSDTSAEVKSAAAVSETVAQSLLNQSDSSSLASLHFAEGALGDGKQSVAAGSTSNVNGCETVITHASSNETLKIKSSPKEHSDSNFDEIPVKTPRSFEELLAAELAAQRESVDAVCDIVKEDFDISEETPLASEIHEDITPCTSAGTVVGTANTESETQYNWQLRSDLVLSECVSSETPCSKSVPADLEVNTPEGENKGRKTASSYSPEASLSASNKCAQELPVVSNKLQSTTNQWSELDEVPIPVKAHRTFEEILEAELAAQENAEEVVPVFGANRFSEDSPISVCKPVPSLGENSLSFHSINLSSNVTTNIFGEIHSHTALLEAECEPALEESPLKKPSHANRINADLNTLIELSQRQEQELERVDGDHSDFDSLAVEASRLSLTFLNASCEGEGTASDQGDANSTFSPNSVNQTVIMADNFDDNCNPFASNSKIAASPPPTRRIEVEEPNPFVTKSKIAASPPTVRRVKVEEPSSDRRSPLARKSATTVSPSALQKASPVTDPLSVKDQQRNTGKLSQESGINSVTNHSEAGPQTASEFVESEVFKDPSSFDFLSLHGGPTSARDLRKESLFVQFDPLVGTVTSHSTPGIILPKMQPTHPENSVQEQEPKQAASPVDTPQTPQKGPVKEEPQSPSKTPLAKNPALANIDKLISFSPASADREDNSSADPHQPSPAKSASSKSTPLKTPAHVMLNETLESVGPRGTMISQEDLIRKLQEHQVVLIEQDKAYQERITELEEEKDRCEQNWTKQLLEKEKHIQNLNEQIQEKVDSLTQLRLVIEEYEQTISRLVAEKEQEKNGHEQAQQHLNNMEIAFSDVHSKYERTKSTVEALKKNEEALKAALAERQANLDKMENMYEMLKSHAVAKLEKANQDFETIKQKHQQETAKLKAMVKKLEIKTKSLEETLEQKAKENQALTAICDELINKVGE